jgi:hypothetical protein
LTENMKWTHSKSMPLSSPEAAASTSGPGSTDGRETKAVALLVKDRFVCLKDSFAADEKRELRAKARSQTKNFIMRARN